MVKLRSLILGLTFACAPVPSQAFQLRSGPVPDRVLRLGDAVYFDSVTSPYLEMARVSYPEARQRFLTGLPPGYDFQIVTRVFDSTGQEFEQIFVLVSEIADGRIRGKVNSEVRSIPGYAMGDPIEVDEDVVYDWCIRDPDGNEEGNLLGKFLDVFIDGRVALILELTVGKDGRVTAASFSKATSVLRQDVTFCIPDSVKTLAETKARTLEYEPADTVRTWYTYVIYNYHEGRIEDVAKK